jgi:hypothetical protein
MKEFFRHPGTVLVMIIIGTILICIIFFKTCTHKVTLRGTVISHNTTSDRSGYIRYYTIGQFDDGSLKSISGLEYYVVEVGGTIYYKEDVLNK